ncbi:MAG: type IV pilus twitching motility protein PilT [Cyanobacteriota bacterium]
MIKITQAPTEPILVQKKFSITGVASLDHVSKNLILTIDNQLNMTGPVVDREGSWQIDFAFQQAGNHHLKIAIDSEKVEVRVQVAAKTTSNSSSVASLESEASHLPVPPPPTLKQLVQEAYEKGFSDIHLGVGKVPCFRNRGEIEATKYPRTNAKIFLSWLQEVLKDNEIRRFQNTLDFDGAAQYEFSRVRINLFHTLKGPAMVLRLIPLKIMTLNDLNAPTVFKDICHYHNGLILVTGPTGSGKSTTLAAMVDYLNEMPKHIITIEDPIEFVHENRKAVIDQREVGLHTLKFDTALKASLREDPDVILIGEMRDKETVNTALKAAQTGHLVFGTLHTNSAVKTIERILNLYNPEEQAPMRIQVAESLVAVVAQTLVRTTDEKRAAAHEIMINTEAIKDYIKRGEVNEIESLIPKCAIDGMCTMNQSLYKLYEDGRITEHTALEASPNPMEIAKMLKGVIV